jgi:GxxExxY protein
LELLDIGAVNQRTVEIEYKGLVFAELLQLDVYVEDCLIVENKVAEQILPVHKTQLLSYMKLLNAPLGLLINYHEPVLKNGIVRLILPGADRP